MIYTVTFNPALDYTMKLPSIKLGETNRSYQEQILVGGKGLNVSTILNNLQIENTALGFIAGFTGQEIKRIFTGKSSFIELENGTSRINVKLKSQSETEINASGPKISTHAIQQLYNQLDELEENDILVLAGSIPTSLPKTIYQDIMLHLANKNILIIVDATNDLLVNVLENNPFLIKPNIHELEEIFDTQIQDREDIIAHATKLQRMGARNVLVSMAGDGAILLCEGGEVLDSEAPKGTVLNSVGAGDSMVAGFIAGWCQTGDYRHAFKLGIASGSASAFSENLATKEDIEKIYKTL